VRIDESGNNRACSFGKPITGKKNEVWAEIGGNALSGVENVHRIRDRKIEFQNLKTGEA
jgi:hypothetical protein